MKEFICFRREGPIARSNQQNFIQLILKELEWKVLFDLLMGGAIRQLK